MLITRSGRVFDLEERARLAIDCLTRMVDPKRDYEPYFYVNYDQDPAIAYHHLWDYGDASGRMLDALTKARLMSGSDKNREIDERLKAFMVSLIQEDGLTWIPDAPWVSKRAGMFSQRSTMLGLLGLYRTEANDVYLSYVKRIIHRIWDIAIKKDNYAYYPSLFYYPSGWKITDEPLESGVAGWSVGTQQLPVLEYYEITRDKVALNLARNMINFLLTRAHDFNEDGSFDAISMPALAMPAETEIGAWSPRNHFHTRSGAILSVLKYGLIAGESRYVEWAKNAYEQAKKWGSSFGWFPEALDNTERCETCCIDDMLEIATTLARNGYSQYWNDVEATGLNHLLESQMLHTGWVKNIPSRAKYERCMGRYCFRRDPKCKYQEECFTRENVMERSLGGFAGWSTQNDHAAISMPIMMMCCNATGVRGLYALWHNAVTKEKEGLFVNLYISRNSKWVEVESLLPQAGILKVRPYIKAKLFIRKPNWMGENVEFTINGKSSRVYVQDGFFNLGATKPGDEVVLYTPVAERRKEEKIGNTLYVTRWVGNIVIDINPGGRIYPLYQRSYLLKD